MERTPSITYGEQYEPVGADVSNIHTPCARTFAACYCALCDMYFESQSERQQHIDESREHPECRTCFRRFLNKKILREHAAITPGHYHCAECNLHHLSPASLQVHLDDYDHSNPPPSQAEEDDDAEDEDRRRDWGGEERAGKERYPQLLALKVAPTFLKPEERLHELDDACDFVDKAWLASPPTQSTCEDDECEDDCDAEPSTVCCPLCEQDGQEMCATHCGHVFCVGCMADIMHYSGECPTCDEALCRDTLRKIYLA
ncbi:hypothetical protein CYLTODRAFT_450290 [Cylindrobasidium torrendii FP15055 ss-10]|uniref:RING-type domain-containing protein n=1 Tax=Cylindrobasidium torrendii FP15055 ss-10 TaxID=1314674 RepID=A0A0D7BP26_9AGAR|nr:hypothetical protein CYLTODRAFT_450290 [Cylindrobasidium torrendii FP15055 ss-10]